MKSPRDEHSGEGFYAFRTQKAFYALPGLFFGAGMECKAGKAWLCPPHECEGKGAQLNIAPINKNGGLRARRLFRMVLVSVASRR